MYTVYIYTQITEHEAKEDEWKRSLERTIIFITPHFIP